MATEQPDNRHHNRQLSKNPSVNRTLRGGSNGLGPTEAVTAEVQLDIGHHQMLVASKAEISKLRIIKHEGSITAATVAVANQMTIYFPSDKIHRTRSWITQLLNAIENHSQRKSIYRSRRRAADGEQSVGWHQSLSHSE